MNLCVTMPEEVKACENEGTMVWFLYPRTGRCYATAHQEKVCALARGYRVQWFDHVDDDDWYTLPMMYSTWNDAFEAAEGLIAKGFQARFFAE